MVVGSHHSVVSARCRCELVRHLLQARIDGLVTELTKDNEKTAREKLRTADDRVKGLEAELEAELEAIRLQALEPAAKKPAAKKPAAETPMANENISEELNSPVEEVVLDGEVIDLDAELGISASE